MPGSLRRVPGRISQGVGQRLRLYFWTGLLLLLPIAVTFLLLKLVFDFLDSILQPLFVTLFGVRIPGVGLAGLVALVLLVGFIGSARFGGKAVGLLQTLLLKLPLVRNIYAATAQLVEVFSGTQASAGAKRVVLIQYPSPGLWTIAFLMSFTADENGRSMAVIYIPNVPLPNSGWVSLVPAAEVYETDLTVHQATQFILSGGALAPGRMAKLPLQQRQVESLQSELRAQREELEARRQEVEQLYERLSHPDLTPVEDEGVALAGAHERLADLIPEPGPPDAAQDVVDPPPAPAEHAERDGRRRWWRRSSGSPERSGRPAR